MPTLKELQSAVSAIENPNKILDALAQVESQEPSRLESGFGALVRGAGEMALEIPKGIVTIQEGSRAAQLRSLEKREQSGALEKMGIPQEKIQELKERYAPSDPSESPLFRAAETAGEALKETFPVGDFPETPFLKALGGTTTFLATGAVGRVVGLSSIIVAGSTGALVNYSIQFQDARTNGASFEDSYKAAEMAGLGGFSEGLPIARLLDRIDKSSGGQITRLFKNAVKGGFEEGGQEFFQQLLGNLIASDFVAYDKDRQMFTGTDEAFKIGFGVGALLNFVGSAFGIKLRRAPTPGVTGELVANMPVTVTYLDGTEVTGIYTKTFDDGRLEVLVSSEKTGEVIPLRAKPNLIQVTPIENATPIQAPTQIAVPDINQEMQDTIDVIKETIGKKDKTFFEGLRDKDIRKEFFDRLITNGLDRFHGIKRMQNYTNFQNDIQTLSPYESARLSVVSGYLVKTSIFDRTINFATQEDVDTGLAKFTGEVIFTGDGLMPVLKDLVAEDRVEDFLIYLASKRMNNFIKAGKLQDKEGNVVLPQGFTPESIATIIRGGDQDPVFKETLTNYQAYNKRLLDLAVRTGVLGEETRQRLEEANPYFVPFYRLTEKDTPTGKKLESKLKGSALKRRIHGSDERLDDLFLNLVRNNTAIIEASIRNETKRNIYDYIDQLSPEDQALWATPEGKGLRAINISQDHLRDLVKQSGFALALSEDEDVVPLEFATIFLKDKLAVGKDIDYVLRDGEIEAYKIHDSVFLDSMLELGPQIVDIGMKLGALGRGLKNFASIQREFVVSNPEFFGYKNLVRDTVHAAVFSKSHFIPLVDTLLGTVKQYTQNEDFQKFLINGGAFSGIIRGGELEGARFNALIRQHGIKPENIINNPKKLLDKWNGFVSAIEYGSRFAENQALIKKGFNPRKAAFGGREVTTDFSTVGRNHLLRYWLQTMPFTRAGFAGQYRTVRGFTDPLERKRVLAKWAALVMAPTLALWWNMKDDEEYKQQPLWAKAAFWMIPIKWFYQDQKPRGFIYIPKPFDIGLIASLTEFSVDALYNSNAKALTEGLVEVVSSMTRITAIPTALQPSFSLSKNETFTGAPIIPPTLADLPPEFQFQPWTSETIKAVTNKINNNLDPEFRFSPIELEFFITTWFGQVGKYGLDYVFDPITRAIKDQPAPPTRRLDETFLMRAMLREAPFRLTQDQEDFYRVIDKIREIEKAYAVFPKSVPGGRIPRIATMTEEEVEQAIQWVEEPAVQEILQLAPVFKEAINILAVLNARLRQLQVLDEDPDEKAIERNELIAQRNEILSEFMKIIRGNKEDFPEINKPAIQRQMERIFP